MKRTTTLTGLALVAALALTACDGTGGTEGGADTSSAPAASAPATSAEPATTGPEASTPTSGTASGAAEDIAAEHNNADIMFARMMTPHHQQAIDMSQTLLAKQDIPTEVRDFAQKVIDAQGPEIERMNAMLEAWGQEAMGMDDREGMGGMGNRGEGGDRSGGMSPGSGSGMNGMMGEDDLRQLEQAQGTEATRLYLEQMIHHHEGAVEMAQDEVDNGQNPQAIQLAQHMVKSQKAEITEMEQMLQELPTS